MIEFENARFLVDAPLRFRHNDGNVILSFKPIYDHDSGLIDAVLVSNFYQLLALPYMTEYSAYRGPIFATEPTAALGKYAVTCDLFEVDHGRVSQRVRHSRYFL